MFRMAHIVPTRYADFNEGVREIAVDNFNTPDLEAVDILTYPTSKQASFSPRLQSFCELTLPGINRYRFPLKLTHQSHFFEESSSLKRANSPWANTARDHDTSVPSAQQPQQQASRRNTDSENGYPRWLKKVMTKHPGIPNVVDTVRCSAAERSW